MKIAYFDCFTGASGDMVLGALLDAGLGLDTLRAELSRLPLSGYEIVAERAKRGGLAGTRVTVSMPGPPPTASRNLDDILAIIAASSLPEPVKQKAEAIFRRLAAAEARVHGVDVAEVHFHEVGSTDAIVDVVGAVAGLAALGVGQVFCSPLPAGSGSVESRHGTLPLPAPGALELLAEAGAPLAPGPDVAVGELVTPTGAAILTTLATFERPALRLERVGHGLGSRELAVPNLLRVWIGEEVPHAKARLLLLETNIDDMNPELYGHVMERLFEEGALDVWLTPIQMKKNRPAVTLSVLAPASAEGALALTILRETSTLGLRVHPVQRHESEREVTQVETSLGLIDVKVKRLDGVVVGLAPEYEACRRLARQHGLPLQEVYRIVACEAGPKLLGQPFR